MTPKERTAAARALLIKLAKGIESLKKNGMTDEQVKQSCTQLVPTMAMQLRLFAKLSAGTGSAGKQAMSEFQAAFPTDEEWARLLGEETARSVVDMFRAAIRKAGGTM